MANAYPLIPLHSGYFPLEAPSFLFWSILPYNPMTCLQDIRLACSETVSLSHLLPHIALGSTSALALMCIANIALTAPEASLVKVRIIVCTCAAGQDVVPIHWHCPNIAGWFDCPIAVRFYLPA